MMITMKRNESKIYPMWVITIPDTVNYESYISRWFLFMTRAKTSCSFTTLLPLILMNLCKSLSRSSFNRTFQEKGDLQELLCIDAFVISI